MNSFSLISHRLFVAAIGNASGSTASPSKNQNRFIKAAGCATAIPVELLGSSKPGPAAGERPLRYASQPETP
jgi:hypothetical protein